MQACALTENNVALMLKCILLDRNGIVCVLKTGAVPEYYPHLCKPDRVSVHEERAYPPHQIGLFTDLVSGCEF